MIVSITKLRENLYKIIDQVIETGIAVEIERKGVKLKIVPQKKISKLENLKKHPDTINGDPNDLIHINWSKEWKGKMP